MMMQVSYDIISRAVCELTPIVTDKGALVDHGGDSDSSVET